MNASGTSSITGLEFIESPEALQQYLLRFPELESTLTVEQLHAEIVSGIVVDPARAQRLAAVVRWMAASLQDEYARGLADRSEGHVRYAEGDCAGAIRAYESAIQRFEGLGREGDVAKTLSGAMQPLIYLGQHEAAMEFARRARITFEKQGDRLRLARLDSNVGNIYYRQDRYPEASGFYRNAFDGLMALNRPQDAAAVLCNMAAASTGLGEFETAVEEYRQAREIAARESMSGLVAQLDYNVAYLHFLRGDHTRALVLYSAARQHSETIGDAYHIALCDLDQAEVYLELNLIDESTDLAGKAASGFERLGMDYERAKALTFLSIGEHRRRNTSRALVQFSAARHLFTKLRNPLWTALTDLHRAILLRDLGQTRPAGKIARRAAAVFSSEGMPHRRCLLQLLLAAILLDEGDCDRALSRATRATQGLNATEHSIVFFHAEYLKGRILRAKGRPGEAYAAFQQAAALLESVRFRLAGDELKVAFVKNKLQVYAELMLLANELLPAVEREKAMFDFIERSKSRSLADRVASLPETLRRPLSAAPEFLTVRQELNALYREIDSRQADHRSTTSLWIRAEHHERHLKHLMTQRSVEENAASGLADWTPVHLDALTSQMAPNSRLIEFFQANGQLWVGVVGQDSLRFKDLGSIEPVESELRFLNFQMWKAQHQIDRPDHARLSNTLAHLQALHAALIKPIEPWIDAEDLIIVPHGLLHQLPFHALHDGSSFLIDRSTVSYAPSATVFSLCERRPYGAQRRSLLMGLPDARNPAIAQEIESLSRLLPEPSVFLGTEATERVLFEYGQTCRYIHIATHCEFRSDNPVFSSIRLGDSRISVLDLYGLKLQAELVTLSGCSTGAGRVVGDELVGLARGLMHAGARSVLLTLWDVYDRSTAEFMTYFYENLAQGKSSAKALQQAVCGMRQDWPEPYYWAPFTVTGYALQSDAERRESVAV